MRQKTLYLHIQSFNIKDMKITRAFILIFALLCLASSCSRPASYDSELCEELAVKIERRDSLSQKDYRAMIAQNEAILIRSEEHTSELQSQR